MNRISVPIEPTVKRIVTICILLEILIFSMDLIFNYHNYISDRSLRKLFNITREDGLANLFSTLQTFCSALCLWLIYLFETHLRKPTKVLLGWLTSALFFSWMALDDGAQVHERFGSALGRLFTESPTNTSTETTLTESLLNLFPSYNWQFIFLPIFGAVALYLFFFWMKIFDQKNQRLLIVSALGLFVFSVILDFIEGLDKNHFLNFYTYLVDALDGVSKNSKYLVYHFGKAIEETLEMLGNTLFLGLFLSYMLTLVNSFEFKSDK